MSIAFDLISIFPQYFAPLELSLVGKAKDEGALNVRTHDLREWATGPHRSVDDSPAGGGAGMVMRPDVWGEAIDAVRNDYGRVVLAIPTPSGYPLTQRTLEDLAQADQIIVACGRYEGIDDRLAQHFENEGMEVLQFSLGDYVLNGGEVAALALVEGVARLQESFMGNPQSLAEESHGSDGLLEYPVYTTPTQWRGLRVPEVLKSGDHGRIARWRRDQSLRRTAARRPDLLASLSASMGELGPQDRQVLAQSGWLLMPEPTRLTIEPAQLADVEELVALAARTFPDACPPGIPAEDNAKFVEENLSSAAFTRYLNDPEEWTVLVARAGGVIAAYTLTGAHAPDGLGPAGSAYLSKCYTDAAFRGSGVTAALVQRTLDVIDAPSVALATNIGNKRAAKFYRRMGFRKSGRREFYIGDYRNIDDVFVCDLTARD